MIRKRRVIGDPILREVAKQVTKEDFRKSELKKLVDDMHGTLAQNNYGIALAAPQIGESKAVIVIELKKTPTRPELEEFSLVLINPVIKKYTGKKVMLRDGCVSVGAEDDPIYGWSERSESIEVTYQDESGKEHTEKFDGFMSHVLQHEIDHLNGILFVDRVKDPKTYIQASEYKKQQP